AALIGFVAGEMAWEDKAVAAWTEPFGEHAKYFAAVAGAVVVVAVGSWLARRAGAREEIAENSAR
ncbi:MAG TPA: hypothetical protein VFP44_05690, partial [Usitatibacter sp.]|nr:hypothetical protein [Usitatibacter sp.]